MRVVRGETRDLRSKERGQEVADDSTDSVLAEDIERIVDPEHVLQLRGVIAADGAYDTEDNGRPGGHKTRGGSDSDQARDRTRAETDGGPLFVETVIEENPGYASNGSSEMGNDARHDGAHVGGERRATVEAEPSYPEEHRAENDMGDIVGSVWEAVGIGVAGAFAKHDGVCEGCCSRGDVNGSSSSEIEASHLEGPSCGVPGPARDGVVDYGRPDEHEDHARKHATSVCCGTDGKSGTVEIVSLCVVLGRGRGTYVMAANIPW